jgi:hypothetical protein
MSSLHPTRVLVVTDTSDADPALLEAIGARALSFDVRFRLVVLNPARAELHLLHPERHDKAAEAERVLRRTLPRLEDAAMGCAVVGSVSVRHDPMDAIEETMNNEPVEEIMLQVREGALASRLHQDLAHRLAHYGLPLHVVEPTTPEP